MSEKIAAVIVTFNRLALLRECVAAIKNQTRHVDELIIINNSSSDGTLDWLLEQKDLTIITQENSGSAGGQYTGIKTAYEKGYDWIWCLDTDVVPNINALQSFIESKAFSAHSIGFLSSVISYLDNQLAYINLPYLPNDSTLIKSFLSNDELPIISASFGSVLISSDAVKSVGLPDVRFFIWGDDAEYTMRMIESHFKGYLVKESKAIHFAPTNEPDPFIHLLPTEPKYYYGIRNTIYIILQRNRILRYSKTRGWLSSLYFLLQILTKRIACKSFQIDELLRIPIIGIKGYYFFLKK